MNSNNPYAQYRQVAVETATPTRQVIMLYDGALRFLNHALPAMQGHDYEAQSRYINKTQAIIAHLKATLDFKAGGEIAHILSDFYIAAYDSLTAANIDDDVPKLKRVIHGMKEIREAWIEVDRQCQTRKSSSDLIAV